MIKNNRKPVIIISNCLELKACRYDGQMSSSPFVRKIREDVELRPVCPEVQIGLGIPREPIRIIWKDGKKQVKNYQGDKDYTKALSVFSEQFLINLDDVDGFILKSKSPSCGIRGTKQFNKDGIVFERSSGIFADFVLKQFPLFPIVDEQQLLDAKIQENFLTKVFALSKFREINPKGSILEFIQQSPIFKSKTR
jgi:uncharacterized protein YbbK (DUF523 family)